VVDGRGDTSADVNGLTTDGDLEGAQQPDPHDLIICLRREVAGSLSRHAGSLHAV
jgi:hypothetical protein